MRNIFYVFLISDYKILGKYNFGSYIFKKCKRKSFMKCDFKFMF